MHLKPAEFGALRIKAMSWAARPLTHTQRVTRLYRRSLKNLLSWAIDRPLWREKALELRDRFDANKDIKDPRIALKVLEEGETELEENRHPQPYIRMCYSLLIIQNYLLHLLKNYNNNFI